MQTVTQQFREQEYSGEALFNSILTINNALVPVSQIASIKIKSPIIDTSVETFYIGTFISQSITIKFKNLDGLDIRSNNNVHLEIGESVDEVFTYIPIGEYLIDDLAENYQETCEITCLDYSVKFKPSVDISACFVNDKASAETIARYICNYFNVELDDSNFDTLPNLNVEIGAYDNTISGKQWLSYIAEINGCNLKMSRDGRLKFILFAKDEPDIEIDALKSAEFEVGEKFELTRVVYFDAVRNYTIGNDTENTLFVRQDNPFVTGENVIKNLSKTTLFNTNSFNQVLDEIEIEDGDSNGEASIQIYGNTRQETTTGKNLYSIGYYSNTIYGLDVYVDNGVIRINGTSYSGGIINISSKVDFSLNGTYTLSTNYISGTISTENAGNINLRNASDNSIIQGTQTNLKSTNFSNTFTVNTGNISFGIYIQNSGITFDDYTIEPQLELGSQATEYEPFTYGLSPSPFYKQDVETITDSMYFTVAEYLESKSIDYDLGNIELCKIADYQDYIYKSGNKWYKHKEIQRYDLSSDSTFQYIAEGSGNDYIQINDKTNIPKPNTNSSLRPLFKCNYFSYYANATSVNKTQSGFCCRTNNPYFVYSVPTSIATDLSSFQDFVDEDTISIYYVLDSSEYSEEEITDTNLINQLENLNSFKLYDGYNWIYGVSGQYALSPYFDFKYDVAKNFKIWSLKNKNYGDISLDAWDIIQFNLGNESYTTYNDNTLTYEMNISTEINTQIPTKQKEITTNVVGGDTETKIKMLKTTLDYVKNEISLLVQETSGLTEQTNQLVMDILSTQNIFQITGGNNLINNSQFLYADPNNEFWLFANNGSHPYNNIGDGYDANLIGKTTAVSKIKLRDTILESTSTNIINLIQNQQYTLNYSYTQDNLTTTTVQLIEKISGNVIFEKTYNNQVSNITNETFTFKAEDTSYIFKVTTATTSGDTSIGYFNIYDLMLNSGDKKSWTPAQNEVYSTVVKMSQMGLSIFAEGSNIVTLLTSQGFQVRKYANGQIGIIITEFTDTGVITGDIESTSIKTGKYISTEMTINGKEHHVEYFDE